MAHKGQAGSSLDDTFNKSPERRQRERRARKRQEERWAKKSGPVTCGCSVPRAAASTLAPTARGQTERSGRRRWHVTRCGRAGTRGADGLLGRPWLARGALHTARGYAGQGARCPLGVPPAARMASRADCTLDPPAPNAQHSSPASARPTYAVTPRPTWARRSRSCARHGRSGARLRRRAGATERFRRARRDAEGRASAAAESAPVGVRGRRPGNVRYEAERPCPRGVAAGTRGPNRSTPRRRRPELSAATCRTCFENGTGPAVDPVPQGCVASSR
jgi:hypothetical protein